MDAPSVSGASDGSLISRVFGASRWRIMWMIAAVSAMRCMDWNVAFSVAAKQIIPQYHLSNVQIGWLISAATTGFVLACTPGGAIADSVTLLTCSAFEGWLK